MNPADVVRNGPLFLVSNPNELGLPVAGFGLVTACCPLPTLPPALRQCRTPGGRLAGIPVVLVALARLTRLAASLANTNTNTDLSTSTTGTSTTGGHRGGSEATNVPRRVLGGGGACNLANLPWAAGNREEDIGRHGRISILKKHNDDNDDNYY